MKYRAIAAATIIITSTTLNLVLVNPVIVILFAWVLAQKLFRHACDAEKHDILEKAYSNLFVGYDPDTDTVYTRRG